MACDTVSNVEAFRKTLARIRALRSCLKVRSLQRSEVVIENLERGSTFIT